MSVFQLLQILWKGRWRLLLCTLACLTGALVISFQLPKAYEARARVILEVIGADPVTGVFIGNKQMDSYIATQVLLVGSDRVAERVIDKLGWATNPQVIDMWRNQTGGAGEIRTWAAQKLLGDIAAHPLEGGGTLEIAYRAADPDAAATIVRAIRESYIETALALETEAAERRAERYVPLVEKARRTLEAAQADLTKVQRETGTVIDPNGVDIESRALTQMADTAESTDAFATREANRAAATASIGQSLELQRKLVMVNQQILLAGNSLGTDNPEYQALLNRRAELSGQLATASAAARSAAAVTQGAARTMAAAPEADYQRERARVLGRGDANIRINQALRLVALRRGEFNRLRANLAEARQSASRSESGLVVMGDVITDTTPVSPIIPLNAALAAAFGFALGLASVLIDGLWRREVLGQADLVAASGVPVLAVMPGDARPPRRLRWPRWLRLPRRRPSSPSSAPATA